MKKNFMLLAILIFLSLSLFSQNYYNDALVYEQLYKLSTGLQAKLYKNYYIDRNLDETFPEVSFFYGRILQQLGKTKEAIRYFDKFKNSTKSKIPSNIILAAKELIQGKKNKKVFDKCLNNKNRLGLSYCLLLALETNHTEFKEKLYKKLVKNQDLEGKKTKLENIVIDIYNFSKKPGKKNALKVLKFRLPYISYKRNFFFDPIFFNYKKQAALYLAATNSKTALISIESFLELNNKDAAAKIYKNSLKKLTNQEKMCLELKLKPLDDIKIFQWCQKFQKKFLSVPDTLMMIKTLLDIDKHDIASIYLTPKIFKKRKLIKQVWEIQYLCGDKKMKDHLRKNVDNWWSLYGVEEESILEQLKLSRYLLGESFITPHVRRLLSVNNPFNRRSKLSRKYPCSSILKHAMLLYISAGRK